MIFLATIYYKDLQARDKHSLRIMHKHIKATTADIAKNYLKKNLQNIEIDEITIEKAEYQNISDFFVPVLIA